jgi:hypothetical protein
VKDDQRPEEGAAPHNAELSSTRALTIHRILHVLVYEAAEPVSSQRPKGL